MSAGPGGLPDPADPARPGPAARLLLALLAAYSRFVSPAMAPHCRFTPSCSSYAATAVRRHGAVRGGGLALWRLLRCSPLTPGGHDPVPPTRPARRGSATMGAAPAAPPQQPPTRRAGATPC